MQNIELTSIEAKEAMKEDRRVEHSRFCGGEWFEMEFRAEVWQGSDGAVIKKRKEEMIYKNKFTGCLRKFIDKKGYVSVDNGVTWVQNGTSEQLIKALPYYEEVL